MGILSDIQTQPLKAILQKFSPMCPKVYILRIFSTVLCTTVEGTETENSLHKKVVKYNIESYVESLKT